MPRNKVTKFAQPISSSDSFILAVSKDIGYYRGESLQGVVTLLSQTFPKEQAPTAATETVTELAASAKAPARILLYADSLNAFNRMIYHRMYPSDPVSFEQAVHEEEIEANTWFDGDEGRMLRNAVSWTHILRWSDILNHSSFSSALSRVKGLYLPRAERPRSREACKENRALMTQYLFSEKIDSLVGKRVAANVQKIQEWNTTHTGQQIVFNDEEAVRLNREYLFHECAGEFTIVAIAEESGRCFAPQYVLYPGAINEAILFVNQIIQDEYPYRGKMVMHGNRIKLPFPERSHLKLPKTSRTTVVTSSEVRFFTNQIAGTSHTGTTPASGSTARQISYTGLFSPVTETASLPLQFVDLAGAQRQLDDYWQEANGSYARFKKILLIAEVVPLDRMSSAQQAELRAALVFLERRAVMCAAQSDVLCTLR